MKLVLLDSIPFNPGDLDWAPMKQLGELVTYEKTTPDQIAERIHDADVVFTNKTKLTAEHFDAAKNLKLVSVLFTGYDAIDTAAAREHGITVCNVPGYSTPSVAQVTFAHMLEFTHHVGEHSRGVHGGMWQQKDIFTYWDHPLIELKDKLLVIAGYGSVGKSVAQVAQAFGMRVAALKLSDKPASDDVERLSIEEGFKQADFLSLHIPLNEKTAQFVNANRLKLMKPSAFLINTGRGGLIDEQAVADALKNQQIAGYGTDVLSTEPPLPDNPLLDAPNCLITPHIAWASREARTRLMQIAVENVQNFFAGTPQNGVN